MGRPVVTKAVVCKRCGSKIGLLVGNPPSADDPLLCQHCYFTGKRAATGYELDPANVKDVHLKAETIKSIVLLYPMFVWAYVVIFIQAFSYPFMAKDIDSWTPSDWVRAVTIVAVEMAVFMFVLWVSNYLWS